MTLFGPAYERMIRNAKPKLDAEPKAERWTLDDDRRRELTRKSVIERRRALAEAQGANRAAADEAVKQANARLAKLNGMSMQRIEARICRALKVTRVELQSARRDRGLVLARQAVCYWTCRLTTLSLPQIGHRLGDRDHSTIRHARNTYPSKRAKMGRTLRAVR